MEGLSNSVYSKNTIEFVTVANEFCKFIESSSEIRVTKFIDTAHRILPLLYIKGTMLPKDIESYEEYNEKFVTEDVYNEIHNVLLRIFGKYDLYDEVFDPLRQENDEPAQLSIAETITDVYQDIKDFILLFQLESDECRMNAIWECIQTFEQYWGQRIVNVMRVLHHLKYKVVELESENPNDNLSVETDLDGVDTSKWLISKMQDNFNDEE